MSSLTDIFSMLNAGVSAINALTTQIRSTFPQASATSTSATAGTITFTSSQAAGFLTVITSSGATFKVPLYNS